MHLSLVAVVLAAYLLQVHSTLSQTKCWKQMQHFTGVILKNSKLFGGQWDGYLCVQVSVCLNIQHDSLNIFLFCQQGNDVACVQLTILPECCQCLLVTRSEPVASIAMMTGLSAVARYQN